MPPGQNHDNLQNLEIVEETMEDHSPDFHAEIASENASTVNIFEVLMC